MNDNQIIELFFTRNEDAIQQTAYKYGTRLTGLAANILRNNEDAQECVNDTYLKAWDTIPPTKPNHFYAYLAKICRFFAFGKLDWKNAAKRNAEVVALTQEMEECIPGSWHDTTVDSAEISSLVSSFLHGQTQENRMILLDGTGTETASARLRCGISSARATLQCGCPGQEANWQLT